MDLSRSPNHSATMAIATKAAECSRLFDEWSKSPTFLTPDVENQIFRFNLWITNNFVFAPTRGSMDWRLRNAPLLESAMVDLLDDLKSNLIKNSAISKNATEPREGGNPALPDAISETLDGLFRLSRAVRRSGILRRFVKVATYTEYDENGVNLTEEFRKGVERIIEFRLKRSKASQDLQKRIIDTICLRQQHFSYLRTRKAKNIPLNQNIDNTQSVPKSTLGATFSVTGSLSPSTGKKPPRKLPRGGFAPSILTATTVQPDRITKAHFVKSVEDTQDHGVECSDADLPPPSKAPGHVKEFECPYCFLVCSTAELSGERWKRHIIQDLMPYVCMLESCLAPNTLFESGNDWLGHMKNQHVVSGWVCMDSSHGLPISFSKDSDFRDHMCQYHSDQFDPTDLEDLVTACHQRLPDDNMIKECPFCPADQDPDVEPGGMINHIAGHLLSLAQISLTGHIDGDGGQSECSESKLSYRLSQPASLGSLRGRLYSEFPTEIEDEEDNIEEYNLSPGKVIPDTDEEECYSVWQNVRKPPEDPLLDPTLRSFTARFEEQADEIGTKAPTDSFTGIKAVPHREFTIGWICRLEIELAVSQEMLDEVYQDLPQDESDLNTYTLGRIGLHNVVLACLPSGIAASMAKELLRSFPNIQLGLMVGVGGGAPGHPSDDPMEDVHLGDVVVSKPGDGHGGVVQYDFGKIIEEGVFIETRYLDKPPRAVMTAITKLQVKHYREGNAIGEHISKMLDSRPKMRKRFKYQGIELDQLFDANYEHRERGKDCRSAGCNKGYLVTRKSRDTEDPVVHYGLIGSASRVIRDGPIREVLRQERGILCLEMEAAGLMDYFKCVLIRGICDYSDSHRNKLWLPYAAAVASAYAKELLETLAPTTLPRKDNINTTFLSDSSSLSTLRHESYTVGWICALPKEMAVAQAMLDDIHPPLPQNASDRNNYILGRMGVHNVVIACLPAGAMGTASTARVANNMLSTFKWLRFGLTVGIGGGVPGVRDIRLGDVVVGDPRGLFGGVIQYDFGKTVQDDKFVRTGSLNRPPDILLTAVSRLQADHDRDHPKLWDYLEKMLTQYTRLSMAFSHPGVEHDLLYPYDYDHNPSDDEEPCKQCDSDKLVQRIPRRTHLPFIHYGLIAAGNQVVRSGKTRDRLRKDLDVLCFEMEAVGLVDLFPCLVIRGICDYSDSHRNKKWQGYAAATAAAYAKELLSVISGHQIESAEILSTYY